MSFMKVFLCLNFPVFPGGRFLSESVVKQKHAFLCFVFSASFVGLLFSEQPLEAFEVNTHRQITEKAVEGIAPKLNSYFIDKLGLEGGLNTIVNGKTVFLWMVEGSETEDDGLRAGRHFHDPISNSGIAIFNSSVDWSLEPVGTQKWSWNDAREYYYKALSSPTKSERDEYWGKTFRALGQIMHLIQDMASPAHVRNDPHLSFGGFGDTDGIHDFMEKRNVATYMGSGMIEPDNLLLEQTGALRSEPFSNLFDFNQFTGTNPDATLGSRIGLAEFANGNFFSDDTIPFQPFLNFPVYNHPSLNELIPSVSPLPSGQSYLSLLRLGSPADSRSRVAKYTGNQALAKFALSHLSYELIGQLQLDDAVYEAYSSHLIPRAVGYSAAVLNYFFRGTLTEESSIYEICSHPNGEIEPWAWLDVLFSIQPGLSFEGLGALYYDLPDGTRVLSGEGPVSSSEINFWFAELIPPEKLSFNEPIPWTIIFQGEMGPGAKEPRAVIGLTGKARWYDVKCPI